MLLQNTEDEVDSEKDSGRLRGGREQLPFNQDRGHGHPNSRAKDTTC